MIENFEQILGEAREKLQAFKDTQKEVNSAIEKNQKAQLDWDMAKTQLEKALFPEEKPTIENLQVKINGKEVDA